MTNQAEAYMQGSNTLPATQQAALDALTEGSSFQEAAAVAGVNRTTVYRWMTSDASFRAEYNAWEQATRDSIRLQLTVAAQSSVNGVIRLMKEDAKFAFNVIKEMGLLSSRRAVRIDAEPMRREIEMEQRDQDREFVANVEVSHAIVEVKPELPCKLLTGAGGAAVEARQEVERKRRRVEEIDALFVKGDDDLSVRRICELMEEHETLQREIAEHEHSVGSECIKRIISDRYSP